MNKKTNINASNSKFSRKEKVYYELRKLTKEFLTYDIAKVRTIGFDAKTIGEKINISRNNVSKELNILLHEKKVIKIKGKPVFYLDKDYLESTLNYHFDKLVYNNTEEIRTYFKENNQLYDKPSYKNNIESGTENINSSDKSILDNVIGAHESLKNQIEQAKAAILYPPHGLHILISGPTGVGKTTLAEVLYKFAVEVGKLPKSAPFIVFNCADYADNPQLLISQLFGYTKGAFTGADKEKKGLIEQANGGILFLDEVHRLPPEGQEMLFLLIDKGVYRKLGESENTRSAKILLILATTENPDSAMLQTLLRRIPVFIKLPPLEKRTLKERINFIYNFFREESKRVGLKIKVPKEVIKALMIYNCPGNVGQLKVDIQLICARAFLDCLSFKKKQLNIKSSHLPDKVKNSFSLIGKKRTELIQYFDLNDKKDVLIDGTKNYDKNIPFTNQYDINEDFYDYIINVWNGTLSENITDTERRKKIDLKTKDYFKKFFNNIKPNVISMDTEAIMKVVDPEIFNSVKTVINNEFNIFDKKIIYGLSLHINTLLERINANKIIEYPNQQKILNDHPKEYKIALALKEKLENILNIKMPKSEIAFLTMFLYAANCDKNLKNVGVLIITHGNSSAKAMADVANTLIGVKHTHAIDMPLNEKVENTFNKALEEVKKIDMGKGVLILVDMGSLVNFSSMITEKTHISTRSIDMVSTSLVIEATRKSLIPDMNLDMLYEDVLSMSSYIGKNHIMSNEISFDYDYLKNCDTNYYRELLVDSVGKVLIFLDAEKACSILNKVLDNIVDDLNKTLDNSLITKFLFHCSCMLERLIRKEPLPYKNIKSLTEKHKKLFDIIKRNFQILEETFAITIPDTEIAYIVEIFDTHYNMSR